MSDQSPPSEHDQLGWLMGEVDRLRAELEQARKERDELRASHNRPALDHTRIAHERSEYWDALERIEAAYVEALRAELEKARKQIVTLETQLCASSDDRVRYRDALERTYMALGGWEVFRPVRNTSEMSDVLNWLRDALAGKGQT